MEKGGEGGEQRGLDRDNFAFSRFIYEHGCELFYAQDRRKGLKRRGSGGGKASEPMRGGFQCLLTCWSGLFGLVELLLP